MLKKVRIGRLTMSAKLYLSLIPVVLLGMAVGYFTFTGQKNSTDSLRRAMELRVLTNRALALLYVQDDASKAMLIDPGLISRYSKVKILAYDESIEVLDRMTALSSDPGIVQAVKALQQIDETQLRPLDSKILEIVLVDIDVARDMYFKRYYPVRVEFEAQMRKLTELAGAEADRAEAAADAENRAAFRNILIVLAAGTVIALLAMVLIVRSVTRVIADVISGIGGASEQVTSAAQQMALSSQNLAAGSSEQAASLEETSSSLEEMSGTIRQTAENSGKVDQMINSALELSGQGGRSVERMVSSIREIKEASDQTAKIVKTIDEIAFQTNLLALNAAVEAARAGDMGRGFAVVAEEVRNLAQRSAVAARETSQLIESSQGKSEAGVRVASEVNSSLTAIRSAIENISALMGELAKASKGQSDGINQLNTTMTQLNAATQATAANAEESSSISDALTAQSGQLQAMVGQLVSMLHGHANGHGPKLAEVADAPPALADDSAGGQQALAVGGTGNGTKGTLAQLIQAERQTMPPARNTVFRDIEEAK